MSNFIKAIINIFNCNVYNTRNHYYEKNRANNMGDALEFFIKDAFANSFDLGARESEQEHAKIFSYLGNQNNPPDMILKDGDAIEVKKIESATSALALNSSYPKSKLYRSSKMITSACRNCEATDWTEKDLIYVVGVVSEQQIKQICMIYGIDYAASLEVYERVRTKIKEGVLEIPNIEFADTNELGRINKVDPLGITYLRIRGMWHIENPFKLYSYVYKKKSQDFNFMAIVNDDKYSSFPAIDRKLLEGTKGIDINNIIIKNPDNPAKLKKAKIIAFSR